MFGTLLAKNWYVVELRTWADKAITRHVYRVPDLGFGEMLMKAHGLRLIHKLKGRATLEHWSGATASIHQTPFRELSAAGLFFREQVALLPQSFTFSKIYLWRTLARSHAEALMLPPTTYKKRNAELLMCHPRVVARPMARHLSQTGLMPDPGL